MYLFYHQKFKTAMQTIGATSSVDFEKAEMLIANEYFYTMFTRDADSYFTGELNLKLEDTLSFIDID